MNLLIVVTADALLMGLVVNLIELIVNVVVLLAELIMLIMMLIIRIIVLRHRGRGKAQQSDTAQGGHKQASHNTSCASGMNPPVRASIDGREILIGRGFYRRFTYDGDCACSAPPKVPVLPSNRLVGMMSGILSFGLKKGATAGFQELLPVSRAEFPLF